MVPVHGILPNERAQWASRLIDRSGDYGAVTALSGQLGVSRPTLYERSAVGTESGLVWAAAGPVAVDHESWTLVRWDLEGRGVRWSRTVADGGGAIGRACRAVDPGGAHARDVWHVLHRCGQAQGRLD